MHATAAANLVHGNEVHTQGMLERRGKRTLFSDINRATIPNSDLQPTTHFKIEESWASLVVQWLRIHLSMQGSWV